MVFINVSQRAGVMILVVGLLVVWALVDPGSLQSTWNTVTSAIMGAFEGGTEAI